MKTDKKRRALPRCPLCGAVMHIAYVDDVKIYKCSNYDKTGCSAQIIHPSEKKKRY